MLLWVSLPEKNSRQTFETIWRVIMVIYDRNTSLACSDLKLIIRKISDQIFSIGKKGQLRRLIYNQTEFHVKSPCSWCARVSRILTINKSKRGPSFVIFHSAFWLCLALGGDIDRVWVTGSLKPVYTKSVLWRFFRPVVHLLSGGAVEHLLQNCKGPLQH